MSTTNPTTATTKSNKGIILFVTLCLFGLAIAIVFAVNNNKTAVQQVQATKPVTTKPVAKAVAKAKDNGLLSYEQFKKEYEAKEAKAKAEAEALAEAKAKAKAKAMKKAKEAKALAKAKAEAKRIATLNKKCWKRIIEEGLTLTASEPTKIEYKTIKKECRSLIFIYSEAVDIFTYDELHISRYKYTIVKVEDNKIKVIKLNKKEKKEKAKALAKEKKIAKIKEKLRRNKQKLEEDIRKSYLEKLMLERKLKATK